MDELKINYNWTGKSIYTKCVSNKQSIVECDKNYYRQLEVDSLLGKWRKAKTELKWKPKYKIKNLVKEMVKLELENHTNDKKKF